MAEHPRAGRRKRPLNPKQVSASIRIMIGLALFAGLVGLAVTQVRLDVPYVPTPREVVNGMLDLAQLTKDDVHIDLGSGDGRIVIAAAQRGARSLGIDLNSTRIAEANANARQAGVADRVTFVEGNLFDHKIADASVLTMYLLQTVNLQLRPRILSELRPGSRVVSHAFNMDDWTPDRHTTVNGRYLYLWIVPGRAEGRWQAESGGRRFSLNLQQRFQRLTGAAIVDGQTMPVTGTLSGPAIELSTDLGDGAVQLRGLIDNNRIEGSNLRASRS